MGESAGEEGDALSEKQGVNRNDDFLDELSFQVALNEFASAHQPRSLDALLLEHLLQINERAVEVRSVWGGDVELLGSSHDQRALAGIWPATHSSNDIVGASAHDQGVDGSEELVKPVVIVGELPRQIVIWPGNVTVEASGDEESREHTETIPG